MTVNEGTLDRAVRLVVGSALLALVFVGPRSPWGFLGIAPLVTGLTGFCPAYILFGIDTRRRASGSDASAARR
jgi:Protein of unknown function (DUF2892)